MAAWLRIVVVALAGASVALAAAGDVRAKIGPFDTTVSARPALAGKTDVRLAPLGSIVIDTHDAPVDLVVRIDELRIDEAERIARDPTVLSSLEDDIARDARRALELIALRCALVAVLGGALTALAMRPRLRTVLAGGATGGVLALGVGALTTLTFDAEALNEPRYSGLLTVAPTAVGDVESIIDRFGEYRAQLTELVGNVVTLYRTAQGLPTTDPGDGALKVLHVSDIHLNPQAFDVIRLLVREFQIDVVADTGDTTDWGTEPEATFLRHIAALPVPYVWVRGNHDSIATQAAVASQPNAVVLDGDAAIVGGLRFWGAADTRYTPDKDQPTGKDVERAAALARAQVVALLLAADDPKSVDVVLVHDPRMATELGGMVPLVLSGHVHEPRRSRIGETMLLVEGSTGGAGLRSLRDGDPEPLTCSVLYFDPDSRRVVAFDRVTVHGLGETGARIERHVIEQHRATPATPPEPAAK